MKNRYIVYYETGDQYEPQCYATHDDWKSAHDSATWIAERTPGLAVCIYEACALVQAEINSSVKRLEFPQAATAG